ncbi:2'-5' RNA ligase family protein [Pseudanabaena sp. FACHB-2040]|uniref:2'-5' RNA ligase family protein n=1 Tax=Pseudanabaena sp. FACHB-2040 TaxID=2692859 RepID=UPI001684FBD7|nr:2'-5' RNA ligase family protein [Pseudanabaena sp. FACHB-2040]MBD2258487.1 2'-5' RNA ligase family protein [Pseudanabaena sp. FACHB-2040]
MSQPSALPLILTLKLDATTFDRLDPLRQQHFPSDRNFLPAHVTLFHALPGDQESSIQDTLNTLSDSTTELPLSFPNLRFLGQGVAIEIDAPDLLQLRQALANTWQPWLSRQDSQRYRPHVTIQNKVKPEIARQLYDYLSQDWQPLSGKGEGLLLWRYQGGPWEALGEFLFRAGAG